MTIGESHPFLGAIRRCDEFNRCISNPQFRSRTPRFDAVATAQEAPSSFRGSEAFALHIIPEPSAVLSIARELISRADQFAGDARV
jgi:hypothetical protein